MKKLIIKESVVDGKMSNAELLLQTVFKNYPDYPFSGTLTLTKSWLDSKTEDEIEDLADDLGYWVDSDDYAFSFQRAKNKILSLANFILERYKTLYKISDDLSMVYSNAKLNGLNVKIKLFLYAMVYHKNKQLMNKKLKQLTGWDYYKIYQYIENAVNEDTSGNQTTISNKLYYELGNLLFFFLYYNEQYDDIHELIKDLMIEKIHQKNKTKL